MTKSLFLFNIMSMCETSNEKVVIIEIGCNKYCNYFGHKIYKFHCRDGRPGSQQVTEEFLVDWGSYMSSRNDVVYVKLDVAGARGLPRALLRGRLGGVEVADQLAVIR